MPFIHIKSLHFKTPIDVADVLKGINHDFAEATTIPLFHIHSTWEFLAAGHYAKGEQAPERHPLNNFPIMIDLLTPDFNERETVELMLTSLASSFSNRTGIPRDNIFINHRQAHSGMVFDDGAVVRW